jgi:O-methyltransferase involved in polyketide biosynthesis
MAIDRGVDTVMNLAAGLDTRPYRMIFRPIYAGLK